MTPRRWRSASLTSYLAAVCVVALLVIAGASAFVVVSLHERADAGSDRQALVLAQWETREVRRVIDVTTSYVRSVAGDPAVVGLDPSVCRDYARPALGQVTLYGPSGHLVCSATGAAPAQAREMAAIISNGGVTTPQPVLVGHRSSLLIAAPTSGAAPTGTAARGALVVAYPLRDLAEHMRPPLIHGARVSIIDNADQVIVQGHGRSSAIGTHFAPPAAGTPGTIRDAIAGQPRIVAAARVPHLQLVVMVSLPTPSYSGQWGVIAGAIAVALLVVLLALLLQRMLLAPTARLTSAIDAEGSGTLRPVRIEGPAEIARIATAFNALADRLSRAGLRLETLRAAMNGASDAVLVFEVGGRDSAVPGGPVPGQATTVYVNGAFFRLTGYELEPGGPVPCAFAEEIFSRAQLPDRPATLLREPVLVEALLTRADGGTYWADLRVAPVEGGRYVLVVAQDITERRLVEQRRAREERQTSALAAITGELVSQSELTEEVLAHVTDVVRAALGGVVVVRTSGLTPQYVVASAENAELHDAFATAAQQLGAAELQRLPWFSPRIAPVASLTEVLPAPYLDAVARAEASWVAVAGLEARGRRLGSLALFGDEQLADFVDVPLLGAVAERLALWIDNCYLLETARLELAERRRAEVALSESEERYREVVTLLQEGIVVVDADDRVLLANPASKTIAAGAFTQGEQGPLAGGRLLLCHEDNTPLAEEEWPARVAMRHGTYGPETILVHQQSGEHFWVRARAVRLELADGPAVAVSFVDITAPRQTRAALEASEARHRGVVESLAEGVIVFDARHHIVMRNAAAEQLLGISHDWQPPTDPDFALLPDGSRAPLAAVEALEANRRVHRDLVGLPFLDGRLARSEELDDARLERRWFASAAAPLEVDGTPGAVLSFMDVTDRVSAELALRAAQERLHAAFAVAQMVTFEYEPGTAHLEVAGMIGVPGEAASVAAFALSLEEKDQLTEHCQTLLHSDRGDLSYRWSGTGADGETLWRDVYGVVLRDSMGAAASIVGVVIDVTDEQRTLRDLAVTEERYRRLVEAAPAAIWTLHAGRFTYANPALVDLLGLDRADELDGRDFDEFVADPGRDVIEEALAKVALGEEHRSESRLRRGDGRECIVELVATPLPGGGGGVQIQARDITALRRAQEELAASERYFRTLVEHSSDVTLVIGDSGVITYVSEVAFAVFGYTPEQMVGRPLSAFILTKDLAGARERLADLNEGGVTSAPIVIRYRHGSGAVRWVAGLVSDRRGDDRIRGIVVNARDVTPEKTYEALNRSYVSLLELVASGAGIERVLSQVDSLLIQHALPLETYAVVAREGRHFRVRAGSGLPPALAEAFAEADAPEVVAAAGASIYREAFSEPDAPWSGIVLTGDLEAKWSRYFSVPVLPRTGMGAWGWLLLFYEGEARPAALELARLVARLVGVAVGATSAREALAESEERFRTAFEDSPIGMLLHDLDGNVIDANRSASALLGYDVSQLVAMTLADLTLPADLQVTMDAVERLVSGASVTESFQKRYRTASGGLFEAAVRLSLVRDSRGAPRYVIKQIEDVSARLRSEREIGTLNDLLYEQMSALETTQTLLRERNEQLRAAFVQLTRAREAERAALSTALHDGTVQVLTTLLWELEEGSFDPSRRGHLYDVLWRAIGDLRNVSVDLVPPALNVSGFRAALEALVERVSERDGLEIALDVPEDFPRFGRDLEGLAFRTVQEGLANVSKHARASAVSITARIDGTRLQVWVRDNGIGVDPDLIEQRIRENHVGVFSMRETIQLTAGTFRLEPGEDKGTVLYFALPVTGPIRGEITGPPE